MSEHQFSAPASPIIRAERLGKTFERPRRYSGFLGGLRTLVTRQRVLTPAVADVSFAIEQGELVGYLGPNGAGKSTTIKMLTGILVPTSGTVEVAGVTPWRDRERNARQIGVVFGQRSQLWWDLPLRDSLRLIGKLYDIPTARYQANMAQFTELLDMSDFLDTPVRQLSLGQRMRGDLAAAMLYDPPLLYLDEPTIGLDVVAKERIRVFIEERNRTDGTTVVLTTHDLSDVERLCRRIILIDHGRVLYDGDVVALKTRYAPYRELVVHLGESSEDAARPDAEVPEVPGSEEVRREEGKLRVRFDPARAQVADLIAAVLARYQVSDIQIAEPDLEGVIRRIWAERPDTIPEQAAT